MALSWLSGATKAVIGRKLTYVGSSPGVGVLHTTETSGWPGYQGGAVAPHLTVKPLPGQGIEVRQHIPFTHAGFALMNRSGGAETNRRGKCTVQVELIGTSVTTYPAGSSMYCWPKADDVVLKALWQQVIQPLADAGLIEARSSLTWESYPASYGKTRTRLGSSAWLKYSGWLGHQHVPENDHGDPGAFPWARMVAVGGGSSSSGSKPAQTNTNTPLLKQGSNGAAVKKLQALLNQHGIGVKSGSRWFGIDVDGDFGPATKRNVIAWQRKKGLDDDGVVGPVTWRSLLTTPSTHHYAAPGDNWTRVADMYSLTMDEIRTFQGGKLDTMHVGQLVRIR